MRKPTLGSAISLPSRTLGGCHKKDFAFSDIFLSPSIITWHVSIKNQDPSLPPSNPVEGLNSIDRILSFLSHFLQSFVLFLTHPVSLFFHLSLLLLLRISLETITHIKSQEGRARCLSMSVRDILLPLFLLFISILLWSLRTLKILYLKLRLCVCLLASRDEVGPLIGRLLGRFRSMVGRSIRGKWQTVYLNR